jgi:hypothetical protein
MYKDKHENSWWKFNKSAIFLFFLIKYILYKIYMNTMIIT